MTTRLFAAAMAVFFAGHELLGQTNVYPSSGNAGVGTTSPGARLEVSGPTSGWPSSSGTSQPHASTRFGNAQTNGVLDIGVNSSGGAWLQYTNRVDLSQNFPILLNPNGGSVGIGTWWPDARLAVYTTSNQDSINAIGNDPVNARVSITNINGHKYSLISGITSVSNSGFSIRDLSDSTDRLVINYVGNVGIGTSTPSHKLAVNGAVRAKEVIVDTGWSDYVFADDYRLAPLREVEAHIKSEKHLPGIPSAAQVAENGVSLGEMQSKLLAKVEELTLHLIAQEKTISEQAARIEKLESKISR